MGNSTSLGFGFRAKKRTRKHPGIIFWKKRPTSSMIPDHKISTRIIKIKREAMMMAKPRQTGKTILNSIWFPKTLKKGNKEKENQQKSPSHFLEMINQRSISQAKPSCPVFWGVTPRIMKIIQIKE